jgi:hypothetical protein
VLAVQGNQWVLLGCYKACWLIKSGETMLGLLIK